MGAPNSAAEHRQRRQVQVCGDGLQAQQQGQSSSTITPGCIGIRVGWDGMALSVADQGFAMARCGVHAGGFEGHNLCTV
jgi:hypothetical protein